MAAEQNIDAERAAPELLPCPFCGGTDVYVERNDYTSAYVQCDSRVGPYSACLARGPIAVQDSDDEDVPGAAGAIEAWNKQSRRASASIGEDGLPELPWGDDFEAWLEVRTGHEVRTEIRQYARDAIAADRRARANSPAIPDGSPQAAQGVKTWEERVTGCGAVEGGHHGGAPRCGDGWYGGIHYCPKCQAKARDAEIADLRAQLARQSQGEPIAYMTRDRRMIIFADNMYEASWSSADDMLPLYAAPPLSSEQQAEKGDA
jgi:hypothetical protein